MTWTSRLDEATLAERTAQLVAEGALDGERAVLVHDLDRMEERVGQLQRAFPEGTQHAVAVKANPLVEVLRVLVSAGAGLECASIEEVALSLAAGCAPERVVFDSPAKTVDELELAIVEGLHLNLDNFAELERVAAIGGVHGHVGLRVNPQVGDGKIAMTSVAGQVSKFGIPLKTRRAELIEAYRRYPWLDGVHVHVGSQGCTLEQLVDGVAAVEAFRVEACAATGRSIGRMDIGGGLPVPYRDGDSPPELTAYVAALRARVPGMFEAQLITEFGRSVQASCGWAVSRVEYVKEEVGARMAVLHLGADALLRRVYQPEHWHHDFLVLDSEGRRKGGDRRPVTLVGPLCFGGDILARDMELPAIEAGDLVVVRDVGAYTLSMWSRHCSRGLPKVVGWRASERTVLKQAESPADVVQFWS